MVSLAKNYYKSSKIWCYIIACDKYKNAPAMQVSQECEVFDMLNSNNLKQVIDKHNPI